MPSQHKQPTTTFRWTTGTAELRDWLLGHAQRHERTVGAVVIEAVAEYRERRDQTSTQDSRHNRLPRRRNSRNGS